MGYVCNKQQRGGKVELTAKVTAMQESHPLVPLPLLLLPPVVQGQARVLLKKFQYLIEFVVI